MRLRTIHYLRRLSVAALVGVASMVAVPLPAQDIAPASQPSAPSSVITPITPADVSAQEWNEVEQFMRNHSPQKWSMVKGKRKEELTPSLVMRYRQLELIRAADAERYRLEMMALHFEDDIYGLLRRLRGGENVENELRAKVEQLVDNRLAWRKERMTRSLRELKALNAREAANALTVEMDRDAKNHDKQRAERVEKRMEELLKQAGKKGTRPGLQLRGLGGPIVPQTVPAQ